MPGGSSIFCFRQAAGCVGVRMPHQITGPPTRHSGSHQMPRFLNVGVDNQVTWPMQQVATRFEGHELVLMPKTREHVTSIHIDLQQSRLTDEDAMTLINRFLSIMSWCDDQFAISQGGWSGNPVPVPVQKRDLAFTTAVHWIFDRKIPRTEDARRAIAIYRDARN